MTREIGQPLIIDAGPALTFLAAGHRKLLLEVIDRRGNQLQTPEAVIGLERSRERQNSKNVLLVAMQR